MKELAKTAMLLQCCQTSNSIMWQNSMVAALTTKSYSLLAGGMCTCLSTMLYVGHHDGGRGRSLYGSAWWLWVLALSGMGEKEGVFVSRKPYEGVMFGCAQGKRSPTAVSKK
jgi:hypothetical protein